MLSPCEWTELIEGNLYFIANHHIDEFAESLPVVLNGEALLDLYLGLPKANPEGINVSDDPLQAYECFLYLAPDLHLANFWRSFCRFLDSFRFCLFLSAGFWGSSWRLQRHLQPHCFTLLSSSGSFRVSLHSNDSYSLSSSFDALLSCSDFCYYIVIISYHINQTTWFLLPTVLPDHF